MFERLFGFREDDHFSPVGQSDDQIIDTPKELTLINDLLIILATWVVDFSIEFFGRHKKSLFFLVNIILNFEKRSFQILEFVD